LSLEEVTLLTAAGLTIVTAAMLWWLHRSRRISAAANATQDTRWIRLLGTLTCVGYGQYLLMQRDAAFGPFLWAEPLNSRLFFALPNLGNILVGGLLLLLGSLLFASTAQYQPWWTKDAPLADWPSGSLGRRGEGITAVILLAASSLLLLLLNTSWLPVALWVAALLLLARQFWLRDRQAGLDLSLRLARADKIWLLLLLLVGVIVGAAYLQDVPARMVGDEGSFWEAAQAIATGRHKPSFFDLGVYTFPMAGSYWQGGALRLFGLSLWSWRFASVLAGVLAVVPLYLLGREWFGRETAVVASLVMLFSPYFLAFARLGYNNSQVLLPVTLALYLASLGIRRSSLFYFWLAGMAAGLGFYAYTAARLGLVALILLALLLWARRDVTWRRCLLILGTMGLAWAVVVLPFWLFGASNPDKADPYKVWESLFFNVFYGRTFFSDAELFQLAGPLRIGYQELFFQPVIYLQLLLRGAVRSLLAFNSPFLGGEEHFVETGLAGGMLSGAFFVLGGALALRGWRRLRFALPLLWLTTGVFLLSATNTLPPRPTHLVAIIPAIALLVAVGVVGWTAVFAESLSRNFATLNQTMWRRGLMALCLGIIIAAGWSSYFATLARKYPANSEQALAWTALRLQEIPEARLVYIESTPQHHDMVYMLWAGLLTLRYENIASAEVLADKALLWDERPLLAFIPLEEDNAAALVTKVAQIIPDGRTIVAAGDTSRMVWGYWVGSIPPPTSPTVTVAGLGRTVWDSPARWVVALLGLLLLWQLVNLAREVGPVRWRVSRHLRQSDEETDGDEVVRYHIGLNAEIDLKRRRRDS
jgi:4-amino-4-deoxy-L-arabinose transferase-like glycosyltransferase